MAISTEPTLDVLETAGTWLRAAFLSATAGALVAQLCRALTGVDARELTVARIFAACAGACLVGVLADRWMVARRWNAARWLPLAALGVALLASIAQIVHPPSPRLGAVANPVHFAVALVAVLSIRPVPLPEARAAWRAWGLLAVAMLLGLATAFAGGASSAIAIATAAPLTRSSLQSPKQRAAIDAFWIAFHASRYDRLDEVITGLNAALLEQPGDPETSKILGAAYLWKAAERTRVKEGPPVEELVLADAHFQRAHRLAPEDAHTFSFAGSTRMSIGGLTGDGPSIRAGYFMLKDAMTIDAFFNREGLAGTVAGLPATSEPFREGTRLILQNYELCTGGPIDWANATDETLAPRTETWLKAGERIRWCGNSEIAPHHQEGFLVDAGDFLAKSGLPAAAVAMYRQARKMPGYAQWQYRERTEERIQNADARAQAYATGASPSPEIMVRSPSSCVSCHGN